MNTIAPVIIIFGLGASAGFAFHLRIRRFWLASFAAAAAASTVWVGGGSLLMWLVAPNELGAVLPWKLAEIFLTTLAGAIAAGWIVRGERATTDRDAEF